MNPKTRGALAMLCSAFLFGITPTIARVSYAGGNNGLMITFLRAAFALPVLFALLKLKGIPIGITRKNALDLALMGTFGSTCTSALYNFSFEFIPVGLATVLNCTYPFFVVLYTTIVFRERASKAMVVSLAMAMAGVVMFSDYEGGAQLTGIIMALVSAISFAFVMLYQYRSSLIELHPLKLTFWQSVVTLITMLPVTLAAGRFTLALTPLAWFCTFCTAMLVSVLALSLLQYGLPFIGSSTASILNMVEPITSVVAGVLLLGETMTILKFIGCALILGAVTLLTASTRKRAVTEPETGAEA